jgi:SAM-dependent methyltransferase
MPLIPREGQVLDVACGVGRHAFALIEAGYSVYGVDINPQAILTLENRLAIPKMDGLQTNQRQNTFEVLDLELAVFPSQLQREQFSGVIITNYLYRPFLVNWLQLLQDRGVFIYETFADGNAQFGKPSNPDFLLRENELLDLVLNQEDFSVVAFEQGRVELPKPAIVQRICAVKHNSIGLQL